MRALAWTGLLSAALAACAGPAASSPPSTDAALGANATPAANATLAANAALEANATLVAVVDGDTIDVRVGGRAERVRLIGIDTPETKRPDSPVECFGPEATAFTTRLLPVGTSLRLERDVVGRDDYGRLLAYVYRAGDGIFVNYEIVRQGYARTLTFPPNVAFERVFVAAARDAEAADAGLWSACR